MPRHSVRTWDSAERHAQSTCPPQAGWKLHLPDTQPRGGDKRLGSRAKCLGGVLPLCHLLEILHAQGKRNPSKTVGVARGHQRADTLKPYSQKWCVLVKIK